MKYLKLYERYNEQQIEMIEDLFTMYIIDKWNAVDATKVPKITGEDYQKWLTTPIAYRISNNDSDTIRFTLFLSTKLIDVDAVIEDTKKLIDRIHELLKTDTFSCKANFQYNSSNLKRTYQIVIKI